MFISQWLLSVSLFLAQWMLFTSPPAPDFTLEKSVPFAPGQFTAPNENEKPKSPLWSIIKLLLDSSFWNKWLLAAVILRMAFLNLETNLEKELEV